MTSHKATVDDARRLFAAMMANASGWDDPRLERAFESVPREAFLPPGPWLIPRDRGRGTVLTPTADPIHLYQNVLVVLDAAEGLNTGEPELHARLLGAARPQPGDAVTHIGAGAGYYTALLAMLVLPNGTVTAYEINSGLAKAAKHNLEPFEGVTVIEGNAVTLPIPPSDVIYVNAGVIAPPKQWLTALLPGGRLIFPWRPSERLGLAALVTRVATGFEFKPLLPCWFVGCVGASDAAPGDVIPNQAAARRTRSVRLTSDAPADASATAVFADVWFSDEPPAGAP